MRRIVRWRRACKEAERRSVVGVSLQSIISHSALEIENLPFSRSVVKL